MKLKDFKRLFPNSNVKFDICIEDPMHTSSDPEDYNEFTIEKLEMHNGILAIYVVPTKGMYFDGDDQRWHTPKKDM